MSHPIYDVVVVGTGAGGGMAIQSLCGAGLKVCALNAGPKLEPARQFRNHRMPYDMKYRGFGNPVKRAQSYGFMDNEYLEGVWEHEIPFTTVEGGKWMWPRCFAVGGKTNFWGRSSARFGEIDFKAAALDGGALDWPVSYRELAPYYSRVERMIGVASTVQGRPSNPDGEYLAPFKFRCVDRILEAGCGKAGVPYLPDRIAQLTVAHQGRPACHFCGNCGTGCHVGSFFSTPWFFLPRALATGNLDLRTGALAHRVLVDANGRASGVAYIDRETKKEVEVRARAVFLAASCIETARIMLNSKSRRWPTGIANSSGQVGRNLCDHLYGTVAQGFLPQLKGRKPFPDDVSGSTIAWMPRWQNLVPRRAEKFVRGYSLYPDGGSREFPGYHSRLEGFGASFKREIRSYYPSPMEFYIQAPSLPSPSNFVELDPMRKDPYGIPVARVSFNWGANELQMFEHAKESAKQIFHAAGGEFWGKDGGAGQPESPGYSLHESGTCRMGNDPARFVTDRFSRTHDVPNLYLGDASVFPDSTDKTTTLSILAFSLRASEHLVASLRGGND